MNFTLNEYVLLIFLGMAIFFDLSQKRIPNYLTLPVMVWGLISNTVFGGMNGFLSGIFGLLAGLVIFLIPFALGWLGGGDVKLMGAVGALQGAAFVFHAALFTAVCGGVLSLIYLLAGRRLLPVLKKILGGVLQGLSFTLAFKFRNPAFTETAVLWRQPGEAQAQSPAMPYGVAIALGTLITLTGAVIFF